MSERVVECLACGDRHNIAGPDEFKGHEWCATCRETTNHVMLERIPEDE